MTEVFKNAVKENDVKTIRSCIVNVITNDPQFQGGEFAECLQYAKEYGIDIFEENVSIPGETEVPEDKTQWTEDLFYKKAEDLYENFAQERIEMLKKIGSVSCVTSFSDAPKSRGSDRKNMVAPLVLATVGIAITVLLIVLLLKK